MMCATPHSVDLTTVNHAESKRDFLETSNMAMLSLLDKAWSLRHGSLVMDVTR